MDDAARKNMVEPWMMPTKNQLQELIDNTNYVWIGGGIKFTNKINISKYICFPSTGQWQNTYLAYVGKRIDYWSTTWSESGRAWSLYSSSTSTPSILSVYCDYGQPIRPTRTKPW